MSFHRGVLTAATASLGLVAPRPTPQAPTLPLEDQVAIYTGTLRAEAATLRLGAPTPPPLLLVPFFDSAEVDVARDVTLHRRGAPLDSALVTALLASGALRGLCWPLAPRRCQGNLRGLGVSLGHIRLTDSAQAWVSTHIQVMQAERDNTYLLDTERGSTWHFVRLDGRWVPSRPTSRPGPDEPSH